MKQKTKNNLIYLSVAGIIVAALAFYIFYTDKTLGRTPEIPGPILWGILSTPGIVALIFERFWEHRRRHSLWAVAIIAAAVNLSAVLIAYHLRWSPPVMVWSTMTVVWIAIIFSVTKKFVVPNHNNERP